MKTVANNKEKNENQKSKPIRGREWTGGSQWEGREVRVGLGP